MTPRVHPTPQGRREARTGTWLPRTQATGPTGFEVPSGAGQAQLAVSVGTVPRPCQSHLGQLATGQWSGRKCQGIWTSMASKAEAQANEMIRCSGGTEERAKRDLQDPNHQDRYHLCLRICLLLFPLPPAPCLRSQLFPPRGPYTPKATSSSCKLSSAPGPLHHSSTLPPPKALPSHPHPRHAASTWWSMQC